MDILRLIIVTFAGYVLRMTTSVNAASMQDVKNLTNKLLQGYNKYIVPLKNQSEMLTVNVDMKLRSIVDIDEREERVTSQMFLFYDWVDESMVWSDSNVDILMLHIDASLMWKPRIALINPHPSRYRFGNNKWDVLTYFPWGNTLWVKMEMFETSCSLDITYYPFDVQRCSIEMFIYGSFDQIIFNPVDFEDHLISYEYDGTWNVSDFYISSKNGPNVTVTYHLERNPRHVIINFLVPIFVLALLNPLVFILPSESGERIGYSMTIMLALSVYMTILGDYLPQNLDPMPLMSYMIMIWYLLSATSLFILFINTNIYYKPESKPIPNYLAKFISVVRKIINIGCMRKTQESCDNETVGEHGLDTKNNTGTSSNSQLDNLVSRQARVMALLRCPPLPKYTGCVCKSIDEGLQEMTWCGVAGTIDVISLVIIYVIKILFAVVFMCLLASRPDLNRLVAEKL